MEPGGISLLESGIWIIPLAIAGVMAAMFAWVQVLQRGTREELMPLLGMIHRYESELRSLSIDAQAYSHEDAEPFGSRAGALATDLSDLQARIATLQEEYVDLQALSRRKKYRTWQVALGAIFIWYDWYRLRNAARSLHEGVNALEPLLQRLQKRHRELQRMGWTVAVRVRSVAQRMHEVSALLAHLSDQRFYGDRYDALLQETAAIDEALAQVDPDFLSMEEELILSNVDKGAVADTYAFVESAQPRLDDIRSQLTSMKQAYTELETEVQAMTTALRDARMTIDRMPEKLDVSEVQEKLRSLETIAETIRSTMKRIEIESLDEIHRQAQAVRTSSEDLQALLQSASSDLTSLEEILSRLHDRQVLLLEQIETLAKKARHPVVWDRSLERARAINAVLEMLGPLEGSRMPEQVVSQIKTAAEILPEQSDLVHHCSQVASKHAEMLAAIDDIRTIDHQKWFEEATALSARTARYAPENWSASDAVARLPEDIEMFERRVHDVSTLDAASPVPESEIPDKVEALTTLIDDFEVMQRRRDRIESRLSEIKTQEEAAWEQLDQAWLTVSQLEGLASGNEFLDKISGRQLEKFHQQLEDLRADFQSSAKGSVERRVNESERLVAEFEKSAGVWYTRLYDEVETLKDELAKKLDVIDSMADLEEPEIERVEQILNEDIRASVSSQPSAQLTLEEIVPLMKRRSDVWQRAGITLKLVEEKIEAPLLAAYSQTFDLRREAENLLAQADRLISQERTWPPTSIEITAERDELQNLESTWDQLPDQPGAVIWVVRRYDELSGSYRSLTDRLRQMVKWVKSEHERVHKLEAQIERDLKAWRNLERRYSGERMVTSRIRKLREDAEAQRERIHRRWRLSVEDTSRPAAYDHAIEALQTLGREVNSAVVRVGSEAEGLETIQLNTFTGEMWSEGE